MKKLYFIIPIILLVVFVFFYLNAKKGIEDAEKARQAQLIKDQEARQLKEEADRKIAWQQATDQANQRIAEYNARQAKEKQQAEEKQAATDERDIAFREKESLGKQASQLTSDLQLAKEQKAKVEEELKIQKTQVDYLKSAAKDVAQTRAVYESALQKLDAAEKTYNAQLPDLQKAAAAAAAAAAATSTRR